MSIASTVFLASTAPTWRRLLRDEQGPDQSGHTAPYGTNARYTAGAVSPTPHRAIAVVWELDVYDLDTLMPYFLSFWYRELRGTCSF